MFDRSVSDRLLGPSGSLRSAPCVRVLTMSVKGWDSERNTSTPDASAEAQLSPYETAFKSETWKMSKNVSQC